MTEHDFTLGATDSSEQSLTSEQHNLGRVLVPLFKGVVYQAADPERWDSLITLQPRIRDHVSVLGLELMLDEAEGWAFLRTRPVDDDQQELPRLMTRRALSFPVSLLVALLRKRMVEFDVAGGATRLVLSRDEIVDMLRLFMPDTSNEAKLIDQVDTHINKVIELGFLRKMKSTEASGHGPVASFEVKRIIRAFVDAQWLSELDEKLAAYAAVLKGEEPPVKVAKVDRAETKIQTLEDVESQPMGQSEPLAESTPEVPPESPQQTLL